MRFAAIAASIPLTSSGEFAEMRCTLAVGIVLTVRIAVT
jgi:hypothetical protein